MALPRSERTEIVDRILGGLTALPGVTAAAVVDIDGLVVHVRRDFQIDTDAVGASVQIMLGSARRAAEHTGQGTTRMLLSENKDGLVLLAPLTGGFVLAVVADPSALLGAVRFEMKETIPAFNQVFA
jgi:hypothetical protein